MSQSVKSSSKLPASHLSLDVALIGPTQQENLPLGYLASSLEAAGHRAQIVRFNTGADRARCVNEVLRIKPDVVGFGISFQYAVNDYLELTKGLRSARFLGHITCGGHVPTFCYREILAAAPGIDTVVRHEGEQTLVALVNALAQNQVPRNIDGLVWREDGVIKSGSVRPPLRDLDRLPKPCRPDVPLRIGGVPIAFMLMSRGCIGDCAYCSIRAFSKDMGGPPFRLREPGSIADEIAYLYHKQDVRVFFIQDDLFILPSESKTIARMEAIDRALEDRTVGQRLFWIKGRPETITANVLMAARKMGAIHLFLGIENASDERLSYLGRTHVNDDNRRAIALCRDYEIRPSFNLMLFDPDCTLDDVASTIDFAKENSDLPWNICRTEIYSGTRLLKRLKNQGRLLGDWRAYSYRMTDLRAEIMFRMMRVCFHDRAFAFDSLLNKLISLSFTRQVHEKLYKGKETTEINLEVEKLIVEVLRDSVDEMRRLLDFASRVDLGDNKKIKDHAVQKAFELNSRDLSWLKRLNRIGKQLNTKDWIGLEPILNWGNKTPKKRRVG